MPSIILVGPWERCSVGGIGNYINYVNNLRRAINDLRIVYSSVDPPGTIPDGIFDHVLSNKIPNNFCSKKNVANQTARLYAMNSYLGVQLCKGDKVIRVRSDLKIKNFYALQILLDAVDGSPDKFIIDYSECHSNILPFNFSDFFIAGRSEKLLSLFDVSLKMPSISRFSLLPFTSHIAGRTRGIITNEQLLWYSHYCIERRISRKIDSFSNIVLSVIFLRNKILLVNRELLFEFHEKYNSGSDRSKIYFTFPSKISLKIVAINIAKDFMKYYKKSFRLLMSRLIT